MYCSVELSGSLRVDQLVPVDPIIVVKIDVSSEAPFAEEVKDSDELVPSDFAEDDSSGKAGVSASVITDAAGVVLCIVEPDVEGVDRTEELLPGNSEEYDSFPLSVTAVLTEDSQFCLTVESDGENVDCSEASVSGNSVEDDSSPLSVTAVLAEDSVLEVMSPKVESDGEDVACSEELVSGNSEEVAAVLADDSQMNVVSSKADPIGEDPA